MSSIVYKLASTAPPGGINLQSEDWRVLTQVNGARSLADIVQSSGMDAAAVASVAERLHEAGVLEIVGGEPAPVLTFVDAAFFSATIRELARAMGPLAEFVLDEEVEKLGETREQFPQERIPDLVECVSLAVPDETKRLAFQQVMLDMIRKM